MLTLCGHSLSQIFSSICGESQVMFFNNNSDAWRLDRKPNRGERIFAAVAAALLAVLCGVIWTLIFLRRSSLDDSVPLLVGFGLAAAFFGAISLRATFGEPRRPSGLTVKIIGYIFVVAGISLFIIPLIAGGGATSFAVGVVCIAIGVTNILIGIRAKN